MQKNISRHQDHYHQTTNGINEKLDKPSNQEKSFHHPDRLDNRKYPNNDCNHRPVYRTFFQQKVYPDLFSDAHINRNNLEGDYKLFQYQKNGRKKNTNANLIFYSTSICTAFYILFINNTKRLNHLLTGNMRMAGSLST